MTRYECYYDEQNVQGSHMYHCLAKSSNFRRNARDWEFGVRTKVFPVQISHHVYDDHADQQKPAWIERDFCASYIITLLTIDNNLLCP